MSYVRGLAAGLFKQGSEGSFGEVLGRRYPIPIIYLM